jgi:hypothetical protein
MKEYKNKEWLKQKYIEEKLSTRKIAKLCGVNKISITYWLKKFDINIRSINESNLGKHLLGKHNSIKTEFQKGHIMSKKIRKGISESLLGRIPWNKNRINCFTKEAREKISNIHKGKIPKNMQLAGKFGNIQRGHFSINGKKIFMRSKWEANYALYLDFLIKYKQILKWEYEPDVFIFEKIKFGTRSYRPDFKIYNLDNTFEYQEVKGYMDSKSKTKIKRMAKYYPDIKLIIIDKDIYGDIKKKLGKMLKFY